MGTKSGPRKNDGTQAEATCYWREESMQGRHAGRRGRRLWLAWLCPATSTWPGFHNVVLDFPVQNSQKPREDPPLTLEGLSSKTIAGVSRHHKFQQSAFTLWASCSGWYYLRVWISAGVGDGMKTRVTERNLIHFLKSYLLMSYCNNLAFLSTCLRAWFSKKYA